MISQDFRLSSIPIWKILRGVHVSIFGEVYRISNLDKRRGAVSQTGVPILEGLSGLGKIYTPRPTGVSP